MRSHRGVPEELQSTYGETATVSFSPIHSFKTQEDLPWLHGGKIGVGQFEACLLPETIHFFFTNPNNPIFTSRFEQASS